MNGAILKAIAGFSVGCLGLASAANATVIASDDFSSNTVGTLNGQGGGTGWSGNWASGGATTTVVSGSLPQPVGTAITPSGNTILLNGNLASLYSDRTFGTTTGAVPITTTSLIALGDSSDTVYFSYLVQRADTNLNRSVLDLNVTGLASGITQIGLGTGHNSSTDWGIWDDGGTGSISNLVESTIASTTNSTLIVTSFDLATGVMDTYIDPQGAALPANPDISYTFATSTGISFSGIQPFAEGNGNGGTPTEATFGNFTFATTYAEVVPEPSSLALMLLPTAGMLIRRRKRRASADGSTAPLPGNILNGPVSANQ